MAGLTQTVAPATEPVTRAEMLEHLRHGGTDSNDWIDAAIVSARRMFEEQTWRQLVTATYQLKLDEFPTCDIFLPKPPYNGSITITYLDINGASQTLAASQYQVDNASENHEAIITQAPSVTWPATESERRNAVTVEWDAGYGAASAVPEAIKIAIKMLVGHWWENRESVVVEQGVVQLQIRQTWDMIVDQFRVRETRIAEYV